jgi:hypothetical protein
VKPGVNGFEEKIQAYGKALILEAVINRSLTPNPRIQQAFDHASDATKTDRHDWDQHKVLQSAVKVLNTRGGELIPNDPTWRTPPRQTGKPLGKYAPAF